jgi:hypothetical protein
MDTWAGSSVGWFGVETALIERVLIASLEPLLIIEHVGRLSAHGSEVWIDL